MAKASTIKKVSVDAGRGRTCAIMLNKKMAYAIEEFTSSLAEVTGATLGLKEFEREVIYYDFTDYDGSEHRFVVGDEVLKVRGNKQSHLSLESSGDYFHRAMVITALRRLDIPDGSPIHLGLLAPPKVFAEAQEKMIDAFLGREFKIAQKGDAAPRTYNIVEVTCLPEGFAASQLFSVDKHGSPILDDSLSGNVLFYDPGVLTLDTVLVVDGELDPEALQFGTSDKHGIDALVRTPILDSISKLVKAGKIPSDFSEATAQHVDLTLRVGLTTGEYKMDIGGITANLTPVFTARIPEYYGLCKRDVLDRAPFHGLKGIRLMVPGGGGSIIQREYLKKDFGDKKVEVGKHPSTKGLTEAQLNAAGLLHSMGA